MNTINQILFLLITAIFSTQSINSNLKPIVEMSDSSAIVAEETINPARENIIFILGEDSEEDNQYYKIAESYYRENPSTKNSILIQSCRSLEEVLESLRGIATDNQLPWGNISLIVHSNEWKGLGISLFQDGDRVNSRNLENALSDKTLRALDSNFVDEKTKLIVSACGLGKNKKLVNLLGETFGDCKVFASPYFIMYNDSDGEIERYEADSYYAFFKTGYRPSDSELAYQLSKRYPESSVDWLAALSRKQSDYPGESYHYFFNIPVNRVVSYFTKEERPTLANKQQKMEWLKEQEDLMENVRAMRIPLEQFRWKIKEVNYTFIDGITEPSISIKGKSSVLCILKARVDKVCGM